MIGICPDYQDFQLYLVPRVTLGRGVVSLVVNPPLSLHTCLDIDLTTPTHFQPETMSFEKA
jgi:hypothetical protein